MPREAREESATKYYHVMLRGINHARIFSDGRSKNLIIELLTEQQREGKIAIVAWCVMDTHMHVLIHAEVSQLSKAIQSVGIRYARNFNKVNKRIGTVFGDRFRSEVIIDEAYLLEVIRYIHNNPVKAALIDDPIEYLWSSFREYFNRGMHLSDEQKNLIEARFGDRRQFEKFHVVLDKKKYLDLYEHDPQRELNECTGIIVDYFERFRIGSYAQLYGNRYQMGELCSTLVRDKGLSLRKTAELLETSYSRVRNVIRFYQSRFE